jgi:hypothetical protein
MAEVSTAALADQAITVKWPFDAVFKKHLLDLIHSSQPVFAGAVGGSVGLPRGWSLSSPGTGDYVVTHNLNTTQYSVVATPLENDFTNFQTICMIATVGATSFEVLTGNTQNNNLENRSFNFILALS